MDLTAGWDFTRSDHLLQAWELVTREQSYLLTVSPPQHAFLHVHGLKLGDQ